MPSTLTALAHQWPVVIAVLGSRTLTEDYRESFIRGLEDHLTMRGYDLQTTKGLVISGGAPGPDTLAIRWAQENEWDYLVFPAKWKAEGRSAGMRRNAVLCQAVKALGGEALIFWDGSSSGTKNTLSHLTRLQIPHGVRDLSGQVLEPNPS